MDTPDSIIGFAVHDTDADGRRMRSGTLPLTADQWREGPAAWARNIARETYATHSWHTGPVWCAVWGINPPEFVGEFRPYVAGDLVPAEHGDIHRTDPYPLHADAYRFDAPPA